MEVLLKFQSTGTMPGNAEPMRLQGRSLTIGRGDDNDYVLPDPDRQISKHHCAIEDHSGQVMIVDFSTNGTFLNYGKVPLGRGPTRLNDGDILSLGSYELLVQIDEHANPPAPAAAIPPTGGVGADWDAGSGGFDDILGSGSGETDFLDELLGSDERPSGPGQIKRQNLADDGILPPLDDEDADLVFGRADDDGHTAGCGPFGSWCGNQ